MVFRNGVKNIQAAAYNGARTVHAYFTYMNKRNVLLARLLEPIHL